MGRWPWRFDPSWTTCNFTLKSHGIFDVLVFSIVANLFSTVNWEDTGKCDMCAYLFLFIMNNESHLFYNIQDELYTIHDEYIVNVCDTLSFIPNSQQNLLRRWHVFTRIRVRGRWLWMVSRERCECLKKYMISKKSILIVRIMVIASLTDNC